MTRWNEHNTRSPETTKRLMRAKKKKKSKTIKQKRVAFIVKFLFWFFSSAGCRFACFVMTRKWIWVFFACFKLFLCSRCQLIMFFVFLLCTSKDNRCNVWCQNGMCGEWREFIYAHMVWLLLFQRKSKEICTLYFSKT